MQLELQLAVVPKSEDSLREAILLGEQMALTEARRMLAMKAQQTRQIPG
jgi:hypothetical protein